MFTHTNEYVRKQWQKWKKPLPQIQWKRTWMNKKNNPNISYFVCIIWIGIKNILKILTNPILHHVWTYMLCVLKIYLCEVDAIFIFSCFSFIHLYFLDFIWFFLIFFYIFIQQINKNCRIKFTYQNTNVGYSVARLSLHSSLNVEPSSMWRSGDPIISATASVYFSYFFR